MAASVPGFQGEVTVGLRVPCIYDIEVASAKYLHGVDEGDVALDFRFSGTAFVRGRPASPGSGGMVAAGGGQQREAVAMTFLLILLILVIAAAAGFLGELLELAAILILVLVLLGAAAGAGLWYLFKRSLGR